MNIKSRIKWRRHQSSPVEYPLQTQLSKSVSIIDRWIHNSGIWLDPNSGVFYWIIFVGTVCHIVSSISQFIALILANHDSQKIFECFSVLTFCGMGLLKLLSLKRRQAHWRSLLSNASALEILQLNCEDPMNVDYESDDEEDTTFKNHIEKYTRHIQSMSTVLSRIYIFTGVVYILSPFIEYALWSSQGNYILKYPHILPGWTPLDELYLLSYVATIVVEGIAAIYCITVHIVFDILTIGMMVFIHGQFGLLHDYCERIGGRGIKLNLSRKRNMRAHYRISICHRIHVSLMKSVNQMSSLTQNILGIYFVLVSLTLCTVTVQFKTKELSITQLLSLLQYMLATLTQLFLFCRYGDAVINESSTQFGEGPFASSWWCLSPRVCSELALLCVGIKRRCRLLAGPFHTLDLPAFILIVRTAYSYYALIRQKSDE